LQHRDPASRVRFCSWLLQSVIKGEINPQLTFFYDEAWFHLQGYINTQNNCYWGSQNPHLTHEVLLHPVKGSVWCVRARRIVGPVFFNETINFESYVWVILRQFFSEFQQDSATAHTARMSDVFRDRFISSDIWAVSSPDLNLCCFIFWGCVKEKVYSNNP
jgi:hypothetical protein